MARNEWLDRPTMNSAKDFVLSSLKLSELTLEELWEIGGLNDTPLWFGQLVCDELRRRILARENE